MWFHTLHLMNVRFCLFFLWWIILNYVLDIFNNMLWDPVSFKNLENVDFSFALADCQYRVECPEPYPTRIGGVEGYWGKLVLGLVSEGSQDSPIHNINNSPRAKLVSHCADWIDSEREDLTREARVRSRSLGMHPRSWKPLVHSLLSGMLGWALWATFVHMFTKPFLHQLAWFLPMFACLPHPCVQHTHTHTHTHCLPSCCLSYHYINLIFSDWIFWNRL